MWLALLGAISFSEASVVSDWFLNDLGWGLLILGMLAHMIDFTMFGLANIRERVLPRGNALPLVMGLLTGLIPLGLSFSLPYESELPLIMIIGGWGFGWLLMGILLLATRRDQDHAAEPR